MKTRRRDFPGTDPETSERLAREVASDENAIINALLELRQTNSMSLEAIGFLLGTDPSQISRYLKGNSKVTLTNYVRIARAFGYRCRIVFEQTEAAESGENALSNLKLTSHKVCNARRTPTSCVYSTACSRPGSAFFARSVIQFPIVLVSSVPGCCGAARPDPGNKAPVDGPPSTGVLCYRRIAKDRALNIQISRFPQPSDVSPSREEVEAAFRTIIRWAGDNPDRPGLLETPARAARAFGEYFAGYKQDPLAILNKTFDETGGYEEMVVLRGISFESHCEHHLAPIIGQAWVAYVPNGRVVGLSKLARVVNAYARRLQIQERMTSEIAFAVQEVLQPQGVGVVIKAIHHCMSSRGVHKVGAEMVTSCMLGCFRDNAPTRQEFLAMTKQ